MSLYLLTEEKIKEAADHVKMGNPQAEVSVIFGVTEDILCDWFRQAASICNEKCEPKTSEEELLTKFFTELNNASVEADKAFLAIIEKAAEEDWHASAFLLKYGADPLDDDNPYADIPDIPKDTDWGKAAIQLLSRYKEDRRFNAKWSNTNPKKTD